MSLIQLRLMMSDSIFHKDRTSMTTADFRRIALSLAGVEESSHMGSPDFRVGGRIFATLASGKEGYRNLKLTPEQQADFVRELPNVFIPVKGGWGRMGFTHVVLAEVQEGVLKGVLTASWNLRRELNNKTKSPAKKAKKAPSRKKPYVAKSKKN
jgi:hypothetical protein